MKITKDRDIKFDNLKGIMIFLVVFCHFIEKMYFCWHEDGITNFIYYTVYLFHMPVFVFISGYFSKGNQSDDYLRKTIVNCLVPYLMFNFIYYLFDTNGNAWKSLLGFTYPQWTLWYMLSLFFWRLLAKPVSLFKWSFPLSILLSLFIGFTEFASFLALARTFSFFPYFLAGYLLPQDAIDKIRSQKTVYSILGFVFALSVSIAIQQQNIKFSILYMSTPYTGSSGVIAVFVRLLLLITGFVCVFGFISTISDKQSIVSQIGKNSVLIYLVHSGVIRTLSKLVIFQINNAMMCILLSVVFSVAVCLLFGCEIFTKAYRLLLARLASVFLK